MDGSLSPYRSRPSRKTPAAAWLGPLGDQSGWPVTVNLVAFHGKLYGNWWNWWKIDGNWWEIDGKLMGNWWEIDGKLMGTSYESSWDLFNQWIQWIYGNLRKFTTSGSHWTRRFMTFIGVDFWPPPQFKKNALPIKRRNICIFCNSWVWLKFYGETMENHGLWTCFPMKKLRDIRDIWVHWTPQSYKIYPLLNEDSYGNQWK